jgi:hypothetical protein
MTKAENIRLACSIIQQQEREQDQFLSPEQKSERELARALVDHTLAAAVLALQLTEE